MTQGRRIIVNIVASHGRSLVALLCGFLTSRWALIALGEENYGLLGVITGLSILVALINTTLSNSVCRYFAYSFGGLHKTVGSIVECQKWFSTAFCIHLVFAIVLIVIGYPIVVGLIRHFMTIPAEKVESCVIVYRWVCVSSFISMLCIPFRAMYTAKQEIAELTVYSLVQTLMYTLAMGYMAFHPGDWFVAAAAWLCFQNLFLNVVLTLRAFSRFPECRIDRSFDIRRLKALLGFSIWEFCGSMSLACRDQGVAVLVNKVMGPQRNASYSVAWSLAGRAQTFANEVDGAFSPAITAAYGAGDIGAFQKLMVACCKFSASLVFLIVIPLSIEMHEFLLFWLKTPPAQTTGLCVMICISFAVLKMVNGAHYGILATGRNRNLQLLTLALYVLVVPAAWFGMKIGFGMLSIGIAYVGVSVFLCIGKLCLAKSVAGFSVRNWTMRVLVPITITSGVSLVCVLPIRFLMLPSLTRMLVLGGVFAIMFTLIGCVVILSSEERLLLKTRLRALFQRTVRPLHGLSDKECP